MARKLNRWIRSSTGLATLGGLLALLLVIGVTGHYVGWWRIPGLPGTAGPQAQWPDPAGGYTCMPSCVGSTTANDGKFLILAGENQRTFTAAPVVLWIGVPGQKASFEVGIFDGDTGRDNTGALNWPQGNWDTTGTTETTYRIFADPLKDGKGTVQVAEWRGNEMPNNDWFSATINNRPEAKAPSGHYFYRFEATRPTTGAGNNAFKVRSTGFLTSGQNDLVNASFGLVGMYSNPKDIPLLHPQFQGDYTNLGPSTYTGEWQLHLYVPSTEKTLEIWDGDFDRGNSDGASPDTDDPNTEGKPQWAGQFAIAERAAGMGVPADDSWSSFLRRAPSIRYKLIDPLGDPIYENTEPSGTEEWERFVVSTDPSVAADVPPVSAIKPGMYIINVQGLDLHNFIWLRSNQEFCADETCGPPVWHEPQACPRTIGYWKNNVKKLFIQNRTNGVQESKESVQAALRFVALSSTLYRSGINVAAPTAISNPTPLDPATEANRILQKEAGNTMLDRALQQNLATWLNLASGKIAANAVISLDWGTGRFEGTVMQALREAESIILNGGDLERAKNIADQINNGRLGEDAPDTATCEQTAEKFPKDKQPPKKKDMPKAPKPPTPPNPTPAPEPDPATCPVKYSNQYNVENPTNNPFYGIKFNYQSGTEVKNGSYDAFRIVIPTSQLASLTSVQMEAKASTTVGIATLTCDFSVHNVPCNEPVQDPDGKFAFYYMGAKDNGDGTSTLTFNVQNLTDRGLSHATIGLPSGLVPSNPTTSYTSQVCQ